MKTEELMEIRNEKSRFLESYVLRAHDRMLETKDEDFLFSLSEIAIKCLKKEDYKIVGNTTAEEFFHRFLQESHGFSYSKQEENNMIAVFLGKLMVFSLNHYLFP